MLMRVARSLVTCASRFTHRLQDALFIPHRQDALFIPHRAALHTSQSRTDLMLWAAIQSKPLETDG